MEIEKKDKREKEDANWSWENPKFDFGILEEVVIVEERKNYSGHMEMDWLEMWQGISFFAFVCARVKMFPF